MIGYGRVFTRIITGGKHVFPSRMNRTALRCGKRGNDMYLDRLTWMERSHHACCSWNGGYIRLLDEVCLTGGESIRGGSSRTRLFEFCADCRAWIASSFIQVVERRVYCGGIQLWLEILLQALHLILWAVFKRSLRIGCMCVCVCTMW